MKLTKGKLYKVIWTNPHWNDDRVYMRTKYGQVSTMVPKGEILLYLGNKLRYLVPGSTKSSCRIHKFLYDSKVFMWTEPNSYASLRSVNHDMTIENTFELVGEQT